MPEGAVAYLVETALADACLHVGHQIGPQGNLRTVEGRLLDDALGTVGDVSHDDFVGLVGSIAEEVAFEHSLRPMEGAFNQLSVSP